MKNIFFIAAILLLVSCQSGNKEGNTTSEKEVNNVQLVTDTLNISGMHCDMCVSSIEKGVGALNGVQHVKANLEDSTAVVKYDAALVKTDEIEQVIVKRGYSVKGER